jgi:hypothetical protein
MSETVKQGHPKGLYFLFSQKCGKDLVIMECEQFSFFS